MARTKRQEKRTAQEAVQKRANSAYKASKTQVSTPVVKLTRAMPVSDFLDEFSEEIDPDEMDRLDAEIASYELWDNSCDPRMWDTTVKIVDDYGMELIRTW